MMDPTGNILYVGKAKNLKKRVTSYFLLKHKETKTLFLVSKIARIDIVITQTEYEALVLENKLIKTLKPKYNIALKDDKTYPYIMIPKDEPFPKVGVVRQKLKVNADYFGPYAAIGPTRKLLRMIGDLFPIRDCKQSISLTKKEPKCINLDIGRCLGPCVKKDILPEYKRTIENLKLFLTGQNKQLLRHLKKEMNDYANQKAFEKAAKVRDQIQKIEMIWANKMIIPDESANIQLWAVAESENMTYILIQTIVSGTLLFQKGFYESSLTESEKKKWIQTLFLDQYNEESDEMLCDETLKKYLPESHYIHFPKRGNKKQLLDLTKKNAKVALDKFMLKNQPEDRTELLKEMLNVLQLHHMPTDIVGFDISHLQGTHIVASAVYFKNGRPDPSQYRKYHIRTVKGKSNDPLSLYEAVSRRLKYTPIPTLLVIDGGKGQLSFARKALMEKGLENQIDIISLAKKEEEVYSPKQANAIKLEKRSAVLRLLQHVRDESHRFALALHRTKRSNALTNIERK